MPSLAQAKSHNSAFQLPRNPVAVFVGGTAGIAAAMARALAQYTNGNAHIIIIGRTQSDAESVIASFPPSTGDGKYEFIKCDIVLMKNVYDTCEQILRHVSRVNYLVMSAGLTSFSGREDTKEGLDKKLAIRYYARWAFIDGLLPGLRAARSGGEQASVMSILGAGLAPKVKVEDIGFKKSYSAFKVLFQTISYNELMVAEYGKREPDIAFSHVYSGQVYHNKPSVSGWWMWMIYFIMLPIKWITGILIHPEESAEYHLYALFQGTGGMYRRNEKGDSIGMKKFPGTEDEQAIVWEHTVEEVGRACETGK